MSTREQMMDASYWRELCPFLNVGGARKVQPFPYSEDPDRVDELRADMERDG